MSWFKSFWNKLTGRTPGVYVQTQSIQPTDIFGASSDVKGTGNFTPRAQQVLMLARKEAERFNHNFIGTEHVLLGLIKLGQGVSVNVLQKHGVDLLTVRAEIEKQIGTGSDQKIIGHIPYTPRVKKVLDLAQREARALNHTYIGTEHLLLGLLREGDGVAARVLKQLGLDVEKTRQEILKELDPNFTPTSKVTANPPAATSPEQAKSTPSPRPAASQPLAEAVDTSKRYDVYCTDWSQGVTIYRNVRFKGIKHLFQKSQYDVLSGFVELEQENGQTVFVSRGSIIRFDQSGA